MSFLHEDAESMLVELLKFTLNVVHDVGLKAEDKQVLFFIEQDS